MPEEYAEASSWLFPPLLPGLSATAGPPGAQLQPPFPPPLAPLPAALQRPWQPGPPHLSLIQGPYCRYPTTLSPLVSFVDAYGPPFPPPLAPLPAALQRPRQPGPPHLYLIQGPYCRYPTTLSPLVPFVDAYGPPFPPPSRTHYVQDAPTYSCYEHYSTATHPSRYPWPARCSATPCHSRPRSRAFPPPSRTLYVPDALTYSCYKHYSTATHPSRYRWPARCSATPRHSRPLLPRLAAALQSPYVQDALTYSCYATCPPFLEPITAIFFTCMLPMVFYSFL
ncbi:hypothetical protein C8F04DRAFT_1270206 [Mycena alexandri]|uniref:Uncharacterized protein n=1 Tax=Mycena alexandri TaxID=1745969 RepID=A0AAD6SB60_9AGAR|nr:hypothetical protein C8F04DRAFT_1270206 [Mycena alexandri]